MARRKKTAPADAPPSRSQKKRDAAALTALGERLTELSEDALGRIPMPEEVREAVRFARTLKIGGARKRQIQRVGKLLREIDAAPVAEALAAGGAAKEIDVRRFRQVERRRDAIVSGEDGALEAAAGQLPAPDRPELERLAEEARREAATGNPKGAKRALFRFLMKHAAGEESGSATDAT
ncbi:MAG: ribosome biogenesis factor YjgA [Desulfococcaceae bacterium]